MARIVGVKFQVAGKIYDFDAGTLDLIKGNRVIVETEKGIGMGTIVATPVDTEEKRLPKNIKKVLRLATIDDFRQDWVNRQKEKEAHQICLQRITETGLNMKLVKVEYLHDAKKAIFYFVADERVDFRGLVKDLASRLHTRIEMCQIGVRDETRIMGGLGLCGQVLCCACFIREFQPVSIRMAKDQNLSLSPNNVSGLCGRLMCCLSYEHKCYLDLKKQLPKCGKKISTVHGPGRVKTLNILKQKFSVELEEDGRIMEMSNKDIKSKGSPS